MFSKTEGSCEGSRSLVESRDRDKKGFLKFLPDPSISIRAPSRFPHFPRGFSRSGELGVIQIRLIPVIFQSFIRHCRERQKGAEGGRDERDGGADVAPAGEVWPHTLLCGRRRRLRQLRNPGITGLASTRRWWMDKGGRGGRRNIREVGYTPGQRIAERG